MSKATRILGFRLDPNDPRKVIPQEVSEEVYFSLGRPIWQHQWKMRSQGKCGMDDRTEMWKCDGDCELCQFRLAGKDCRLDAPVGSADGDGCTAGGMIPSDAPGTEEAALNRATMEQLFKRLGEVYPEAMDVARLMMVKQLSIRQALKELGIDRNRFQYAFKRAEERLCREFDVDLIARLFDP